MTDPTRLRQIAQEIAQAGYHQSGNAVMAAAEEIERMAGAIKVMQASAMVRGDLLATLEAQRAADIATMAAMERAIDHWKRSTRGGDDA